jgi:hypothetical protein
VQKSTLSDFRMRHLEELSELSTQILAALVHSNMLPGEQLAVDGSVIRAAASCHASCSRRKLKNRVARLEKVIQPASGGPSLKLLKGVVIVLSSGERALSGRWWRYQRLG